MYAARTHAQAHSALLCARLLRVLARLGDRLDERCYPMLNGALSKILSAHTTEARRDEWLLLEVARVVQHVAE